jgi:hypothetical protein
MVPFIRPVVLLPVLVAMLAGCEHRAADKARHRRPASTPAGAPATSDAHG